MSLPDLLSALGQAILMAALAFGLVCLLISHLRFQSLAGPRSDAAPGTDTLTVLLARRMSTAHREPEPFAVLLVGAEPTLDAEAWSALAQRLRDRLRDGDDVVPFREHQVAVVVPASRGALPGLVERLLAEEPRSASLRIGVAAYPEDGRRTDELRKQAEAALAHSLASGQSPAWPPGSSPPAPEDATVHPSGRRRLGRTRKPCWTS
jgi:GGDEF domain-containing protein